MNPVLLSERRVREQVEVPECKDDRDLVSLLLIHCDKCSVMRIRCLSLSQSDGERETEIEKDPEKSRQREKDEHRKDLKERERESSRKRIPGDGDNRGRIEQDFSDIILKSRNIID